MLLLGGLDLGYQSYLRAMLQGALNDVARSGSMEAPELGCEGETVEDQVRCAIETKSDVVARNATYRIVTRNFYEFSGVGRSEKLVTDHNNNGVYDTGDCWEDLNENGRYDSNAGRDGMGGADDVAFYEVTLTMRPTISQKIDDAAISLFSALMMFSKVSMYRLSFTANLPL